MKIGLIDADNIGKKSKYPNIALMKLSSYHKSIGDHVEWYRLDSQYNIVYVSKVFDFTPEPSIANNVEQIIYGGCAYGLDNKLPDHIEHVYPDYSLYNVDKAYGFLTRGCPRNCGFCNVTQHQGKKSVKVADLSEFWNGQKEVILMDNNVLAHAHGLKQIEKIIDLGIKIDFNQGLDARIIAENKQIAELLSKVKWSRYLRMACDTKSQMKYIAKSVELLNNNGIKNYKIFV